MKPHFTTGYTLIEIVIVLGLFGMLTSVLTLLFLNFNGAFLFGNGRIDTAGSANTTMTTAEKLILPARHVLASHVFTSGTYSSASTTLVLELPSHDASGAVISSTYDYAVLYKTGTTIYALVETNAASARRSGTKILSTSASNLTFTYNNADFTQVSMVDIALTMSTSVKQSSVTAGLRQQMYLRNFTP